ncbi:hypothetical protein PIB30_087411 [Stylosanthes scabra]|uniref:Uncharacterized protein n=1 Tax=Stylosanthes scabra TaxID=79078 RepID=A0ABU6XSG5_9FABA|nr:hypothetical protein [Stylosanthes scabra]
MTSGISSLAKILESQSSPCSRLFIQESITSTLNTKSTPRNSPNNFTSDMDVDIKGLYQEKEDAFKLAEYVLNKFRMPSPPRRVPVNAKATDGKYIGKKASSSFVLPRHSFCQKIPDWMPMAFRVPDDMFLVSDEVACATYIFGPNVKSPTSSDEILVTTGANFISRKVYLHWCQGNRLFKM